MADKDTILLKTTDASVKAGRPRSMIREFAVYFLMAVTAETSLECRLNDGLKSRAIVG